MKYGVRLCGYDYELNWEDGDDNSLYGFITTRFVKAKSWEEAEEKAVQMIIKDPHLNRVMVSNPRATAYVRVEEMWQENWWKRTGGSGYSFYPMNEESEENQD